MNKVLFGQLAKEYGYRLPLQVLSSSSGFYLGTQDAEGPVSRESVEYWPNREAAHQALLGGDWTQRQEP